MDYLHWNHMKAILVSKKIFSESIMFVGGFGLNLMFQDEDVLFLSAMKQSDYSFERRGVIFMFWETGIFKTYCQNKKERRVE